MTADQFPSSSAQLLTGVKVIDFSWHLAGPTCTTMLADFGADVIKVESLDGDHVREYPPFTSSGESGSFITINRNKRGISINLREQMGRDIVRKLIKQSDVLVQNFRPGVMARHGLSYDELATDNPRLIYCSISGFGQNGPRAQEPGKDLVAQAMTGLISITGHAGEAPAKCGPPICDISGGLFATIGILAALVERSRSGKGQHLETSLFDAGMSLLVFEMIEHFFTGRTPVPVGTGHRLGAPYQAFRASDGYFIVVADSDREFPTFCKVLGLDGMIKDRRFTTTELRVENINALVKQVEAITEKSPRSTWIKAFMGVSLPAFPIHTVPEALADPQTKARGVVLELEHPDAGKYNAIAPALRFERTPVQMKRPAPKLGQHTREVLADIGIDAKQLDLLVQSGVIK